jgi:hypothetical protein
MAGDWFLIVHAKLASGPTVEQRVDVPGVRAE